MTKIKLDDLMGVLKVKPIGDSKDKVDVICMQIMEVRAGGGQDAPVAAIGADDLD